MATKKELSALPKRSEATKRLNSKLKIVKLNGYKHGGKIHSGFAFVIPSRGVLAFKSDKSPYTPIGGWKALKEIVEAGGFLNYSAVTFYKIKPSEYEIVKI